MQRLEARNLALTDMFSSPPSSPHPRSFFNVIPQSTRLSSARFGWVRLASALSVSKLCSDRLAVGPLQTVISTQILYRRSGQSAASGAKTERIAKQRAESQTEGIEYVC